MDRDDTVQDESQPGLTILVVEDDHGLRQLIERTLRRAEFQTASVSVGAEAIDRVAVDDGIVLLLDYQLPDMTGKEVVERLWETSSQVPFVMMTGQGDEKIAVEMMKLGARDYVVKDACFLEYLPQVLRRVVREVSAERRLGEAEAKLREAKRSIFTLMGNLPGMAYRCLNDSNRTMKFVSEGCVSLTGYQPAELLENSRISYMHIIHADDRGAVDEQIQSALDEQRPFQLVYRIYSGDGGERWLWEKGSGVFSSEGELQAIEGFMTDITDRKRAEADVLEYARQLETLFNIGVTLSQTLNLRELMDGVLLRVLEVFDMSAGGIFLLEKHSGDLTLRAYRGISEEFAEKVGRVTSSDSFAQNVVMLKKPILVEDVDADPKMKKMGMKEEGFHSFAAVPIQVKEKVLGMVSIGSSVPRKFLSRDVRLFEAITNQIAMAIENAQLYEETVQIAFTDGLTGLYNRRYLVEQIEREFARAKRGHVPISVIMIDLDGLKTINDNFGHRMGDVCLCKVAEAIKRDTRASDVAARWGGDEFVILTPDTESADACSIGERIRAEVEQRRLKLNGTENTISVSVGVASYPANASEITELLQKVDEAVYDAKRLGKNRVSQASTLASSDTGVVN